MLKYLHLIPFLALSQRTLLPSHAEQPQVLSYSRDLWNSILLPTGTPGNLACAVCPSPSALPPHQKGQAGDVQPLSLWLGISVPCITPGRVVSWGINMRQGSRGFVPMFSEVKQQFLTRHRNGRCGKPALPSPVLS